MDITTLLTICRKRWRLVTPILLLTILVAWFVSTNATPTYEAQASVLVLGPSVNGSNPFGELNNAITSTAVAIQRSASGEATREKLRELGLSTDYEISPTGRGQDPILDISVRASDEKTALETIQAVLGMIRDDLASRQKQLAVADENLITTQVLASDSEAEVKSGSATRSAIFILVLGTALAASAAVALDHLQDQLPDVGSTGAEVDSDTGDTPNRRLADRLRSTGPAFWLPPTRIAQGTEQGSDRPANDPDERRGAEDHIRWPA